MRASPPLCVARAHSDGAHPVYNVFFASVEDGCEGILKKRKRMWGNVGLRLGFEFAACDEREEMRVGCVVGVCKARAEFWRCGSYLGGQGGIGVLIGLRRVR